MLIRSDRRGHGSVLDNAAGERRPTLDDTGQGEKSLSGGPSALVAGFEQWIEHDLIRIELT